ncbi:unnamed protein product, partial [marine sediment metagenome]
GREGRYVPIEETVHGFKEILEGKHDAPQTSLVPFFFVSFPPPEGELGHAVGLLRLELHPPQGYAL